MRKLGQWVRGAIASLGAERSADVLTVAWDVALEAPDWPDPALVYYTPESNPTLYREAERWLAEVLADL